MEQGENTWIARSRWGENRGPCPFLDLVVKWITQVQFSLSLQIQRKSYKTAQVFKV